MNNHSIFIGLDLGDKYSHFCQLDGAGAVVKRDRVRTTVSAMRQWAGKLPGCCVVFEAGTHSLWVQEQLDEAGHETIVANPRELRSIYRSKKKCDRNDAEKLARLARADRQLVSPIQHRNRQAQMDLKRLRIRDTLVQSRSALVCSARGTVKSLGHRVGSCSTESFVNRARRELEASMVELIEPLLRMAEQLSQEIKRLDKELAELSENSYPETELLREVNGVGPLTSLAFVLTLESAERFKHSRDVGSYLGLVPKLDQSGEQNPQLRITKAGNNYLRRLLVGCAHYILGPFGNDCDLRHWGLEKAGSNSKIAKKKAVVAVARKVAVLLHRLWKTGEVYDPFYKTGKKEAA